MSWYGIDAVDRAFSRTKKALFEPFDFWKWVKLAIIVFFVGSGSSNYTGSGNNYRMSPEELRNTTTLGSDLIHGYIPQSINSPITSFSEYGLLIALIAALILIFLLFFYISSVMEFVFVESLVKNEVKFWAYSRKFLGRGFNLLLVRLALLIISLVFLGIAALPLISSIMKMSSDFSWSALMGGFVWFIGVLIALGLIMGIISSFISLAIPVSIYRNIGLIASLKLVFANFRKSWKEVVVYWFIRFIISIVISALAAILFVSLILGSGLIFLAIDGILYFLFSSFVSEPLLWILLLPFAVIELVLFFGALLLISVPLGVFPKYYLLSFLEAWFEDSEIPFFDAAVLEPETGFNEPKPNL